MRILLNSKFYNKNSVEEALKDFKGVCEGRILNNEPTAINKKDIEVELKPKEEIKELEEEFCNYVLGLMKNKMLV